MGIDDFLQMALLKRQIHAYPSSWLPTDMPGLQGGTKVKTAIHTFPSHEGGGKACTRIMTESATQSTKQKSPPAVTMPTATTLVKVVGVDSKLLCIYL